MSFSDKELDKLILMKLLEGEDLDEVNVTGNMDGGEGPVKTPHAFSKSGDEDEEDNAEVFDYKKTKPSKQHYEAKDSSFKQLMGALHEISYKDYKADESMSQKQKVNKAISEINRRLYEIEKIARQNVKLKQESGVDNTQYWKSTKTKMGKISERLLKVAKNLRDLGA